MNVHNLVFSINGIKDSPVTDSILGYSGQVESQGLMPKVVNIGGQPLGFIKETLSQALLDWKKVINHRRPVGNSIPRHIRSPMEAQFFSDLIPSDSLRGSQ
jgi:hypothetical protein